MENTMVELSELGFCPFFEEQLKSEDAILARIAAEHRAGYEVWSSRGESFARLSGRLTREGQEQGVVGVGDWVTLKFSPADGDAAVIERVLSRRTAFIRGAAGRQTRGQIVAANVDVVFIVTGLDADFSPRRIERYLARVWASGADPVIVLNKVDLCENPEDRIREVEVSGAGAPILVVSAARGEGVDEVREHLGAGRTAAFVGSSGAGKSTLINALLGETLMTTGEVRARDGRGCHTTTHRRLILLPGGGLLIDTPGMRELQLFDDEGLEMVFSDIEELALSCRFRDCTHDSEPGCAVRRAIENGDLSLERFESYTKLEAEAHSYELRRDVHQKRKAEKAFGKLVKDVTRMKRWERGE